MMTWRVFLAAACHLGLIAPALASAPGDAAKSVTAVRTRAPIVLDGKLDEPAWQAASAGSGFWQRKPKEGAPPALQTEFRVLYDDSALYVGVLAQDDAPHEIRGFVTRRDQTSASDWLEIGIDSYHDRRTAFVFAINPAGVKRDYLIYDGISIDENWNSVWDGATSIVQDGWVAEFRIPLGQLRYPHAPDQTWGLQVTRIVGRTQEESVWSPAPSAKPQIVSLFGTLQGLGGLGQSYRLELLPYALGGLVRDPGSSGALAPTGSVGLDAKYGLGSGFTLSSTINPDFGQVEADPSVVNLTDVETFLEERRPFFVEGSDLFRFHLPAGDINREQIFYSRRIGAPPHAAAPPGSTAVSLPETTTIYGALKLSGKTGDGWSVGALDAVTAEERARFTDDTGSRGSTTVEPLTNYAALQVHKESNQGRTRISGALTSVSRRLDGTGLASLHDQALAGGLRLGHRFWEDRWRLDLHLLGSHVQGSAESLLRTQRASQRYFQRPDASHVELDPTRTSLGGAGMLWALFQDGDDHVRYGLQGDLRSPGLELNDLGYQVFADRLSHWGWVQWRDDRPGDTVLRYEIESQQWLHFNWEPQAREYGARLNGSVAFTNRWEAYGGVGVSRHVWDPRYLRGGPAIRRDVEYWGWFGGTSDQRRALRASLDGEFDYLPATGTWWVIARPSLNLQVRANLDVGLGLQLGIFVIDDQYVTEVSDANGASRYILGHMEQSTAGITLRANYSFTPELSVQLYAQPFVSAGRFDDYKAVVDPGASAYADRVHRFSADEITAGGERLSIDRDQDGVEDYGFARADFNVHELIANLILRWEYRPGSTLFLVWRHTGSRAGGRGELALGDTLDELVRGPSEDAVLLKIGYWFGL